MIKTAEETRLATFRTLPEGEKKILEFLIFKYPESVTRKQIVTRTGYMKSTLSIFLQHLRKAELIEFPGMANNVRASGMLFQ